jgi:Tol biopolymer transport system component
MFWARGVVALAVIAALAVPPAEAQPERILFASTLSGSFDLFAVDPDGSHRVALTFGPAQEWDPAISPDGAMIAFARRLKGLNSSDIWVMAPDGSQQRRLNHESNGPLDRDPAWSAGGWITWTRSLGGPGLSQIWKMRPDGTGRQAVTEDEPGIFDHSPAWSPDGSRIAFVSNRGKRFTDIWVMHADGANMHRLTNTPGKIEGHPSWSPDGSRIAYECRFPQGLTAICIMNQNGTGERILSRSPGHEAQPSWSPGGDRLVYTSAPAEGGNKNLVTMSADGGAPATIVSHSRIDFDAAWGIAPTGSLDVSGPAPESNSEPRVHHAKSEHSLLVTAPQVVAPGVSFSELRYESSDIFVVRVKPHFKPTIDVAVGGKILAGRERVSSVAKAHGAVAAINGDFPLPSGKPSHPFAEDGDLKLTSFAQGNNFAISVDEQHTYLNHPVELLRVSERDSGDAWMFERWNFGTPTSAEIAAFSPPGGAEDQPPRYACSARLKPTGRRRWAPERRGIVRPFQVSAARCSVERMDRLGGVVLSAQPGTDGAFLLDTLRTGEEVAVSWYFDGWSGVADSIGGFPALMDKGEVVVFGCPSRFCIRHPRSGIGITTNNVVILVVADGRRSDSAGLTLTQFGRLFDKLGATDAVNLDGGGSSTMVVNGMIRNEPSDKTERAVCCTVLVLPGSDEQEHIDPAAGSSVVSGEEGLSFLRDPGSTGGMLDAMARGSFGARPSTMTREMRAGVRHFRRST